MLYASMHVIGVGISKTGEFVGYVISLVQNFKKSLDLAHLCVLIQPLKTNPKVGNMNKTIIFQVQFLLVLAIGIVAQCLNVTLTPVYVARYVLYVLFLEAVAPACQLLHKFVTGGNINVEKIFSESQNYVVLFFAWLAVLVYNQQTPFNVDFVYVGIAFLLIKYQKMRAEPRVNINYGVGMACSFFEGYLIHTIPSNGANFRGFEENVKALEGKQGVLFPSKKLFIVITKDLFCPPDLNNFNKDGRTDLPTMEAFSVLENVIKSVAGVKDRVYRHTAYKIVPARAGAGGAPPVCVMAECATPLHTLHRVLNNRTLYQEVADIDVAGVVEDFCRTLNSILDKSPECQGKCELIYYDNSDPKQNLADLLLARIRELVPDFEKQILARKEDNLIEGDVKYNRST